jgi:nickel transport protein
MRTRFLVLVIAAVVVAVLSPDRASAHDLQLRVKLPPDEPTVLLVEAGFDDDTPADGAKVVITDAAGKVIAEGKTDEKGVWKTMRPPEGKYAATVESIGHMDKVAFEVAASGYFEFRGWRLDKTLGIALGVGGLLLLSAGFWWFRLRKAT